ncbi:four helix bundle protein [Litoribacter populi]|uniref:four helix bundle protein n=1 Tax=Litoribacter populi TaxID=2598460 RepID=UPI001180D216|nr:four helix bundle protein [Litoribacter populi]
MKTYHDLEIYKISFELFIETHRFSHFLPKQELYELGSQIRRSADSINSNIVEGYGRRKYKNDFLRFLNYAHASNLETINHLKKISILYPEVMELSSDLSNKYGKLGVKIYNFIDYVSREWRV